MSFHFGSSEYAETFLDLPEPNVSKLRSDALEYLKGFDSNRWFRDPIASLLNGQELCGGPQVDTVDALGKVNGRQDYATPEQITALKTHIRTFVATKKDCRDPMRAVEKRLLVEHAGALIGNQCIDFSKQDGITEMEEATMANHVERRLNDILLREEAAGRINVERKPIYVACVSNFSNFLDLFRKTVRSLEVGIPCVILGRSNTCQHSYRWARLLVSLMIEEGLDPGMLTFLSCPLDQIKDITQSLKEHTGNLYATCSRQIAASMMASYPNTVASTGGPNTLIAMDWSKETQAAIKMSAAIESSGQCTALRHVVVPPTVGQNEILEMLNGCTEIGSAIISVEREIFDGVFPNHVGTPICSRQHGYEQHKGIDAMYRLSKELPPDDLDEFWRRLVIDVTQADIKPELIHKLAEWLNRNQPISVAIMGKTRDEAIDIGLKLWSETGVVVFSIGTPDSPAMTCQARPQEAEIFGEFPPRSSLNTFTKFPVIIPSSTPSYGSTYTHSYLQQQAARSFDGQAGSFLSEITDTYIRGYCVTLLDYLINSMAQNPKRGYGKDRTALWGLQRPPLSTTVYIECNGNWDELAPSLFVFFATNAKEQVVIVSSSVAITDLCQKHGIACSATLDRGSLRPGDNFLVISDKQDEFVMAGQFLTTLLPVGHIKSAMPDDTEFLKEAKASAKWLALTI